MADALRYVAIVRPLSFTSKLSGLSSARKFSTSFHLSLLIDPSYYLLSSMEVENLPSVLRNFPNKDDFKNKGYSAVMVPGLSLSSAKTLRLWYNLRYIKQFNAINSLYRINLLKDEDD